MPEMRANADLPMIVRDAASGGLMRVNRTFTEQLAYVGEELAAKPLLEWIEPRDRTSFRQILDGGHGSLTARHRTWTASR